MDGKKWRSYSEAKSSMERQGLTPDEYERRARALARKLKI